MREAERKTERKKEREREREREREKEREREREREGGREETYSLKGTSELVDAKMTSRHSTVNLWLAISSMLPFF